MILDRMTLIGILARLITAGEDGSYPTTDDIDKAVEEIEELFERGKG